MMCQNRTHINQTAYIFKFLLCLAYSIMSLYTIMFRISYKTLTSSCGKWKHSEAT